MALILRSGSFLKAFSSLRQSWTRNVARGQWAAVQRLQAASQHASFIRMVSVQSPVESVRGESAGVGRGIDQALYRVDTAIRRTGRTRLRDVQDIYGEMKTAKQATSTQGLLLLRCCCSLVEESDEDRNQLVQEIWDSLQELGVPLDISHYNILLRVYLENNHKFSPTDFLAELERRRVEPNRVTYQRLITRYCQDGDIDGATKILEYMKEQQLPVGEKIFHALIMGHARANDMESAKGVLEVMKRAGLEPTAESFTTLLVSCAERGNTDDITAILEECQQQELVLHDRELFEVIYTLAVNGHMDAFSQMLERLQKQRGYVQDAVNVVYRLINAGCHEAAYQIYATVDTPKSSSDDNMAAGHFFIRHLIKREAPMTTVLQYCQEMKARGITQYGLETALHAALSQGRPDAALFVMRVMNEDAAPLRPHYFWPIILHYARTEDVQKIYDSVKEMLTLEVVITMETSKNYLMPALLQHAGEDSIMAALKEAGMTMGQIMNGLVGYYLDHYDIKSAARLVSRYQLRLLPSLANELALAFLREGSHVEATALLGQMIKKPEGTAGEEVGEEEEGEGEVAAPRAQQDVAGAFLQQVVTKRNIVKKDLLPLLKEMESRGISISEESGRVLQQRLAGSVQEQLKPILQRLASGDLTYQPLSREPQQPYHMQTTASLERRLLELQNKNLPTANVLVHLLLAHVRSTDVEKAEEIKKRLDEDQCPVGAGALVLLMDMYVAAGRLTEAQGLLQELEVREPDARLSPSKLFRLALLMVQEGQVEEAVKLLELKLASSQEDDSFMAQASIKEFLNFFAAQGDVVRVRQVLDLVLGKVVQPSTTIFGPLIKAHLAKDDLSGAVEEFEKICMDHKITPMKHELTVHCLNIEAVEKLQKIMDLSTSVHGELNSLYDMVFCFVESGRIKEARKLMETPGLRAQNMKLQRKCQNYVETGKLGELENLVAVTKDVFDVDQLMLYTQLLEGYKKANDCSKAAGLWTSMQEEDIDPNQEFLHNLGDFLLANGYEVPFVMPEKKLGPEISTSAAAETIAAVKDPLAVPEGQLSIHKQSKQIEALVQENKISEAVSCTQRMLLRGQHPLQRIFKYYLSQLAKAGDVENIVFCHKYIDEKLQSEVNFNNNLCMAYLNAGRTEELLNSLSEQLKSASEEDLPRLKRSFPKGGIMGILQESPQYLPKVVAVSEEYAARGLNDPANCLWMYYFSTGQQQQAQEVYNKYLSKRTEALMFRSILKTADKTGNTELLKQLLELLQAHPNVFPSALGLVYSHWVNILTQEEKVDEALGLVSEALKKVSLEDLSTSSLSRLEKKCEATSKPFPHLLPAKSLPSSSRSKSSSSSDSD